MGTLYDSLVAAAVPAGSAAQTVLDGDYAQLVHTHPFTDVGAAVVYTETAPAAIPASVNVIELSHATVAIEKTIASLVDHKGLLVIKNTSASGTAAHKVTVTTGTFNGTHKVATLDAPDEMLVIWIDSAGKGAVILNAGTVGLA